MCPESSNSSSLLSSENDFYENKNEKPFVTNFELSSDEVINCGIDVDPFVENNEKFNKQKERGWLVFRNCNFKKAISLPLVSRRRINNFYEDFNNGEIHSIPTLGIGRSDSLQRISADVLCDLLLGKYNISFRIIDCRFSYEYEGGHIKNAINISNIQKAKILFKKPKALIFHCEYSSVRAPKLAHFVRNIDRKSNVYPKLTLPEIYILDGGYKEFYRKYSYMCTPQGYVSMGDVNYKIK
ncbi:m-phase inducer phosphatase [Vairimorpha apis BRL 01]|uniref:M-phase inducer phosphatase n=1 Tax=Vairimorpha apis BRL 01 TaxID=1037528 RepID=T0L645_9MICR|nr:m-phase inducer phosphatase [Vairimorpha apis BRL 01]EQB61592.1 m-phase inducer phosphatase [Vairimorpha apis BRL 01]